MKPSTKKGITMIHWTKEYFSWLKKEQTITSSSRLSRYKSNWADHKMPHSFLMMFLFVVLRNLNFNWNLAPLIDIYNSTITIFINIHVRLFDPIWTPIWCLQIVVYKGHICIRNFLSRFPNMHFEVNCKKFANTIFRLTPKENIREVFVLPWTILLGTFKMFRKILYFL